MHPDVHYRQESYSVYTFQSRPPAVSTREGAANFTDFDAN
jgi:hypothetical protein